MANRQTREILPYLCAKIANSMIHRGDETNEGFLVFSMGPKRVTIYDSGKMTLTKVDNGEDARMLLEELRTIINET